MSSMKKNALAAALVAGLGLAGTAAAYNYGTLKDPANCGYTDCTTPTGSPASEQTASADLLTAEPVAYQNITISSGYRYTMREQLVWDINPPDNAVNFTNGFTARMVIEDGALFDTSYTPTVFNVDPATCSLQDNDSNPATPAVLISSVTRTTQDIYLDPSLVCTWDVAFDNYYTGGQVISIRITPKQGITNPQNPSQGMMLRYDNAHLASLDEFVNGPIGNIVHGTFWLVNPTNDAEFQNSRIRRDILQKVSGVTACADGVGETNKFVDVADNFLEAQKPKTRFSFDGRLGSAEDSNIEGFLAGRANASQTIDLGNVTLGAADGIGGFAFTGADMFHTVLTGDGQGWAAFDNGDPAIYNDDVYLVNGSCASGAILAQGEVDGGIVYFDYTGAQVQTAFGGFTGNQTASVSATVCAFADTDVLINDQNIRVTTTFTRADIVGGAQTFDGATCNLLPLRYNGSTMEIFTINPADNDRQRSFIRLTNRSTTPGYVRLEGIDDNGVNAPGGQVSVMLAPGQSIQMTATELENGGGAGQVGAWGNGTGKWRAVVTAEFPGLVASSYVRNTIGDILANITDADTRGEQITNDFAEGTFGSEPGQRASDMDQEFSPDYRGNNSSSSIPGGPNGGGAGEGPRGGTTAECGNPGLDGTRPTNCTAPVLF